ncbi:MAG: pilus assembly protein [Planctomycetes bacterium]|nr:pilus assembly protein [Planctomycetota bacterium]
MVRSTSIGSRSGATTVELAAVISVFVLLLFGILEFCLVVYTYNVVQNASREGARYAVVNSVDTTMVSDTQNVVKTFMGGLDTKMKNYKCQVYLADAAGNNIGLATDAQFGEYVLVDVQVDYVPLTPGLGFLTKTFTIRSKCGMGSEAN